MTRSILVVCTLVLLTSLALAQPLSGQRIAVPSPPVKEQTTGGANSKPYPTEQAPLPVRIIESATGSQHTKTRETQADKHDAKDLDAQIRAANAAEKQILPSWAGAILSFVGTLLILWSLCESREANRLTRRALLHAKETDRAWMAPKEVNTFPGMAVTWRGAVFREAILFQCIWENSGQTPAHNVSTYTDMEIAPFGTERPQFEPQWPAENSVMVSPGGSFHGDRAALSPESGYGAAVIGRQAQAFLYSAVRYYEPSNPDLPRYSDVLWEITRDGTEMRSDQEVPLFKIVCIRATAN